MGIDILKQKVKFKCANNGAEEIPKELFKLTGSGFPGIHTNMNDMVKLSKGLKNYRKDTICKLPFCATVEAEALGASINLGDERIGPRVKNYAFNTIEELINIKDIDLCRGRIGQVLDSVENLSDQNEVVCLNIEGPFTIISSLVDPGIFYSAIRKKRDIVDKFMHFIEENLAAYALEGIKRGAKIISYADPAGAMDIVGPKTYKDLSGKSSCNLLKSVLENKGDFIIHLCGKMSTALEELGFCTSLQVEYDKKFTYGEAINLLFKNDEDAKIIGHSCIKRTPLKIKKPIIWNIKLN
ncbi:MAG: uroporphyrinogen decarboxylase family protein [Desulfobacterium sp.]|nr:uroporphyrinogen decarboxylase family protein [Desulfobacterium sp.]